ncbi:MAG: hypothetical protein WBP85_14650 [Terracidiphilus sp.]
MRTVTLIAAFVAFNLSALPVCASSPQDKSPDSEAIAALEVRADQAQPREQCFLYAQLIQQMTELSIHQYAAGDFDKATHVLKHVQYIAQKLHIALAENDKRLKDAEILLSHSAFRLNEMLHSTSMEDRPLVQETLAQVSQAQNATMMQVFRK